MDAIYHRTRSKLHYQKYKETYRIRNEKARERIREIIHEAKSVGCKICGETAPCALDFHHLFDKDMHIAGMHTESEQRVRAEIAKCVVVCSNCHRKIHANLVTI